MNARRGDDRGAAIGTEEVGIICRGTIGEPRDGAVLRGRLMLKEQWVREISRGVFVERQWIYWVERLRSL